MKIQLIVGLICLLGATPLMSQNSSTPEEGELLQDGGFEEAVGNELPAWSVLGNVQLSEEFAAEGKKCLLVDGSGHENAAGETAAGFLVQQSIPAAAIAEGEICHLRFNVRPENESDEFRGYIGLWGREGWITGFGTEWRKGRSDWQEVELNAEIPPGVLRISVVLEAKAPGKVWFDHVSLKKMSAP